ncbi:hypothetical protein HY78_15370 [Rhizorhabdus wittichii DC-6]|nr:hypothetical protein HY78_15370 [Rhizorhabdus wittichii DC-6]
MSLEDREAIRSRLILYGFAVDSLRWDLFDEIFAAEGLHVRHGEREPWTDLATFKRDFEIYHRIFDSTRHSMTNFLIEVDGDTARSITYGQYRLVRFGAEGGDHWYGEGWYEDEHVRTPAGWRLRRRQSRQVYREGNDAIGSTTGVRFLHKTSSLQHSEHALSLRPALG